MIDYIKQGDCLDLMNEIPKESIDLILVDPPYGVLNSKNKHAEWDQPLDMSELWQHWNKVLKKNGTVVLFGQGMFTADVMISNKKMWRYNLIWDKERVSGFLNANRQPLRCHEDIMVFSNSQTIYNPQMQKCSPHQRNHSRGKQSSEQTNRCYGNFGKAKDFISDEKFPRSIIYWPNFHDKIVHPTQKPVGLLEYLIKTYTNEGATVLDCCMGSGSTCLAAIRTGRHYIGFELQEEYFNIAQKRINIEKAQPKLFNI